MSVQVVAEIGVNHNGDLDLAVEMIRTAAECGADVVKFQSFHSKSLVTQTAPRAGYQVKNMGGEQSQLAMLSSLELPAGAMAHLMGVCEECGVGFLSTPFDKESLDELLGLGVMSVKVASGDVTNVPLLRAVGSAGKRVILSTGMSTLDEVGEAIAVIRKAGSGDITLLHCSSEYPAPFGDVNLRAMTTMQSAFHLPVGYSDHTPGIEVPIGAVALGACLIEKHFTLDRSLKGPDHKASLVPTEFSKMVDGIRHMELALGDGVKRPTRSEVEGMVLVRRSIVASRQIRKGELLTEETVMAKRPGSGLSAARWDDVIGTRASRDFDEDEMIEL